MTTKYGVYSNEQQKALDDIRSPKQYVYYQRVDTGQIVQVTEVFSDKSAKSKFADAQNLGEVTFYKVSPVPILPHQINPPSPRKSRR